METQQGYRIQEWGQDPVWEEFPRPTPGPGELLVRVEACSVGLTVLNCINGDISDDPTLLPRVPGHEVIGRVTDAGTGRGRELVGRRIASYTYLACGSCLECLAGTDSRCRNLRGWVGVHIDGGYAPYSVLPAHNAIPLPEEIDPVAATVICDAAATSVHICRSRAKIGPTDRVAVIGAGGGIGIHLVQVAQLYGARVAALDIDDQKLEALEGLGAQPVRSDEFHAVDPAAMWNDGPPTVVVDFVGSERSLTWSSQALGRGGRMIVLTTFRNRTFTADPRSLVFREASILGSLSFSRFELAMAAQLVASGRIRSIIGATASPDDVLRIHGLLRSGKLVGRGALSWL